MNIKHKKDPITISKMTEGQKALIIGDHYYAGEIIELKNDTILFSVGGQSKKDFIKLFGNILVEILS